MNKLTTMGKKSVSLPNGLASVFLGLTVLLASCSSDDDDKKTTTALKAPVLADLTEEVPAYIGVAIAAIVFENTGGDVASDGCTVAPALPMGLTLAVAGGSCQITGIPAATPTANLELTITAKNATSMDAATVTIRALTVPMLANPAAAMLTAGTEAPTIVFTNTGDDVEAAGCSITAGLGAAAPFTLPAGLELAVNEGTCEITGTPTTAAVAVAADFTITGMNAAGPSAAATVSIAVAAAAAGR